MNSIDFFQFDDPISLLNSYVEHRKQMGQIFSYRWFSQRAGFKSPNYLHLILNRKRKLNVSTSEKICEAFKWSQSQRDYFMALCEFKLSRTAKNKQQCAQRLLGLRLNQHKKQLKLSSKGIESLYASPLNVIIRELCVAGIKNDPNSIQDLLLFDANVRDIKKSIQQLLSAQLIKEDQGLLVSNKAFVSTGDEVTSELVKKYHEAMMNLAVKSMYEQPREQRDLSTVTLHLPKERMPELKNILQRFRKEILALETEQKSSNSQLIQVGFQIFPLTKEPAND